MKSIKPGRGPSGMNFIGSIVVVIFGVFWTILAISITASAPFGIIGYVFPLFGFLFIILGIVQMLYHYKNATGKNRFSAFDITDSSEESDPAEAWIKKEEGVEEEASPETSSPEQTRQHNKFCPYCGTAIDQEYSFCPNCGKALNSF